MARKSDSEVERVTRRIEEAEAFMAKHKANGVTSWDQIPEDDLYDWDSRIKSNLEFTFRKGYQKDPVLADLKRRHDSIWEWDGGLGGYDN
jgi:hypothetical protein